jgi:uncharacterized protein (UPF0210 family)
MAWAGQQLDRVVGQFEANGYQVQTRRVALGRWDIGFGPMSHSYVAELLKSVDMQCCELNIDFCSIGIVRAPSQIEQLTELIASNSRLSGSADVASSGEGIIEPAIRAAARSVRYLALNTEGAFGNFRFSAACCLGPGAPFFPGSYHEGGPPSFSIGLENSDLLVEALRSWGGRWLDASALGKVLAPHYSDVAKTAVDVSSRLGLKFLGVDTSITPSLHPTESVTEAFRVLGIEFGAPGTLALCGLITSAIKRLQVEQVGYCGLMLPVLEDVGLAEAANKGRVRIGDLLAYASVCGVGLDMIPIPGDSTTDSIEAAIRDVSTISVKLSKPLSVRLLPIPDARAGQRTSFTSQYVYNANVMAL